MNSNVELCVHAKEIWSNTVHTMLFQILDFLSDFVGYQQVGFAIESDY